jgi:hypothetical protein
VRYSDGNGCGFSIRTIEQGCQNKTVERFSKKMKPAGD